ncbi:recombinase RecA, partial [candidate division WWE3 bacterium CG10_big_fil_rev_8_21_14_0_10_32_10]
MLAKNVKQSVDSGKNEALKSAISQIEKEFGTGSVLKLGESSRNRDIEIIKTG